MIVAEVQPPPDILRNGKPRGRGSEIGEHKVAGSREIDVIRGVLRPILRLFR